MEYWMTLGNHQIWIPKASTSLQACMFALYDILTMYYVDTLPARFIVERHGK